MCLDLYEKGVLLGSVVRSTGTVYAYLPDGRSLGQFADLDAAAAALSRQRAAA